MNQAAVKRPSYKKQQNAHPISAELCVCAQCSRTGNVETNQMHEECPVASHTVRCAAQGLRLSPRRLLRCSLHARAGDGTTRLLPGGVLQGFRSRGAWWAGASAQEVGGGCRRKVQRAPPTGPSQEVAPKPGQSRLSINHPLTSDLHCTQGILLIPAQAAICGGLERFGWAVRSRDRRRLS